MASTPAVSLPANLIRRTWGAAALRVVLLAAIVLGPLPAAGPAFAQGQSPTAPFPRSAAFLPSPTGLFIAVNLAPDPAQRSTLDRLFNYYMQDPDVASGWHDAWDSIVPGMSGEQVRDGMASWIGGEAFISIPSPGALGRMMDFSGAISSPADIPFLGGVAVRDPAGLVSFLAAVGSAMSAERGDAAEIATTVHNGMTVMSIPTSMGPPAYVAMPAGFMIFSHDQQIVFDALDRAPAASLASSAGFQEVNRTSPSTPPGVAPLAVFYADSPGFGMPLMTGAPTVTADLTAWTGATIRIDNQGLRFEQVSAPNADRLSPAMRALMTTPANPYESTRLAPRDSSLLLAINHLDLVWAMIKELMSSSPDTSDMIGQATILFRAQTGLDLDRDIFGWMTGEVAGFMSPGGPEAPAGIGGGLVIQAADAATAQARVAAVVDAISRSAPLDMLVEQVSIGGAPFNRIRSVSSSDLILYLGSVGAWVVAADAETVVAGIVLRASNPAELGLSGDPAFTALRGAMPSPSQNLVYVDITALVELFMSAAGPPAGDAAQIRFFIAPFKRVMAAGVTSAERSRSIVVVQIAVP